MKYLENSSINIFPTLPLRKFSLLQSKIETEIRNSKQKNVSIAAHREKREETQQQTTEDSVAEILADDRSLQLFSLWKAEIYLKRKEGVRSAHDFRGHWKVGIDLNSFVLWHLLRFYFSIFWRGFCGAVLESWFLSVFTRWLHFVCLPGKCLESFKRHIFLNLMWFDEHKSWAELYMVVWTLRKVFQFKISFCLVYDPLSLPLWFAIHTCMYSYMSCVSFLVALQIGCSNSLRFTDETLKRMI